MEGTVTIKYWWKCGKFPKGIPSPLSDALHESAMERITDQMKQGIVSGELFDNVNIDVPGHKTPEDGYECSGGFTINGLVR